MNEIEREPCPRCGEPAALAGRVCPHCRGSLLVDVVPEPVADARERYRIAKAFSAAGGGLGFARTRDALTPPGAPLATGVTRLEARALTAALEAAGGRARSSPSVAPEGSHGRVPLASFAERPERSGPSLLTPWVGGALVGAALVVLVLLFAWYSSAPTPSPPPRAASLAAPWPALTSREIARRALDSIASLSCARTAGAGFFAAPDVLVTNEHVLCRGDDVLTVRLRDGRKLPGTVVARDAWLDLGVVRVFGAAVPPLPLGDATELATGEMILAIGNPIGLDFSATRGIVSHAERNRFGIAYIQFEGTVQPGNSGGPLLDSRGRAVGIVSMAALSARGLALALPINYVWEAQPTWIAAPTGASRERWATLLNRVRLADGYEAKEAAASAERVVLSSAGVTPDGELVAVLLSRGWRAPGLSFQFSVNRDGRELCAVRGAVELWEKRGQEPLDPSFDVRYVQWLRRNRIASELWVGVAPLSPPGCLAVGDARGAELVLLDGDPRADRAPIRSIEYRLVP